MRCWQTSLHRVEAEYALLRGSDPGPALAAAEASLAKLAPYHDSFEDAEVLEGQVATVTAEQLLARVIKKGGRADRSETLEAALSRARRAFVRLRVSTPWSLEYAVWLSRVEVIELEYQTALGEATGAQADATLAPIAPFLSEPRDAPRLYEIAARAREARAERLLRKNADASMEIEACLARAEEAVAAGPGIAAGRARLGRCRLLWARTERDPGKRKQMARLASEAFAASVKGNPLLAGTNTEQIREVERLREAE